MQRQDPLTVRERSTLMAKVLSAGNASTELTVARALRKAHVLGWRRGESGLPGSPDFLFRKQRVAVFVHGCFWHGCPTCYRPPKSRREFWHAKMVENRRRDARVVRELRALGYGTVTIWEHELETDSWMPRLQRRLARK